MPLPYTAADLSEFREDALRAHLAPALDDRIEELGDLIDHARHLATGPRANSGVRNLLLDLADEMRAPRVGVKGGLSMWRMLELACADAKRGSRP